MQLILTVHYIITNTYIWCALFKMASVVSEGDVGEDGMSKEEREKQRKRKAAERLREINKRKKIERVGHQKQVL